LAVSYYSFTNFFGNAIKNLVSFDATVMANLLPFFLILNSGYYIIIVVFTTIIGYGKAN